MTEPLDEPGDPATAISPDKLPDAPSCDSEGPVKGPPESKYDLGGDVVGCVVVDAAGSAVVDSGA